jgi:two-component system nitrogen regulation sensor histidine kinase GlnL
VDAASRFQPFDLLASLVAVVRSDASVIFSNAALEDALGISRRTIVGSCFTDAFTEPVQLRSALERTTENEFASLRYDALLKRLGMSPFRCM